MSDKKQETIRTPLGAARGLGSAKEGVHHWWMQRVSAMALVPLSLYWLAYLPEIASGNRAEVAAWLASPCTAIAAILFVIASFYHAALGIQVIIEDYVIAKGLRMGALLLNNYFFFLLGVACIYAILFTSFTHGQL